MLTRESLENSFTLTDRLDSNGFVVEALPGSPLAALVKATRASTLFTTPMGDGSILPDISNIEYIANTKSPDLGYSPHDVEMDDLASSCATHVTKHIAFARGTVLPTILDLVEKITTAQKQAPNVSVLLGMEVIEHHPAAPMTNPAFRESLKEFDNITFHDPVIAARLPSRSFPELLTMMETGKSSVDGDIAAWAAAKGESFFLSLWAEVFQGVVSDRKGPRTFHEITTSFDHGADAALAIYLLSRRLVEDTMEDSGMSLTAYNNTMTDLRDQSGMRLFAASEALKRELDAGILVKNVFGKVTTVNGTVYKDWIENGGGANEILFGNALASSKLYRVVDINAASAQLRSFWNRHEVATVMNEKQSSFTRNLSILRKSFEAQLSEITNTEEGNPGNITAMRRLFEEQLHSVREDDLKDLFGLCMRLVCRARYYRTDAEFILDAGQKVMKEFPNINVREAYAMATLKYIVRWVLSQTKVRSVG